MAAQAEAMVSLIQTTIATVLAPLVGQIDAQRQTIERQADQLVSQAGAIGRLEAENAALVKRLSATHSPSHGIASDPSRFTLAVAVWRSWWPWLLALVAIVGAAAVLAWPR